jgi:hypothetical protein
LALARPIKSLVHLDNFDKGHLYIQMTATYFVQAHPSYII